MYSFQRGGILRTISIETALVLSCFFIALGPARAELRYDIQGDWTG